MHNVDNNVNLSIAKVDLSVDKKISLVRIFDSTNTQDNKMAIRAICIMVENVFLTTRIADTEHFMSEIRLFEGGNDQNKYLGIEQYKSTKNLRIKHTLLKDCAIFISKAEAHAMFSLYNKSFGGYRTCEILENEMILTPKKLTVLLSKSKV